MTFQSEPEESLIWYGIFKEAIDSAFDGMLITDAMLNEPGPHIVHANPAFCRLTGYSLNEVIGRNPRFLQGPETDKQVIKRLRDDLENGRIFEGSTLNYRKDGSSFVMHWTISPVKNHQDETTHYVAVQRDVTEIKKMLSMLRHQAVIDGLTGAVNRAEAETILETEIKRAERYSSALSLIMLDLDKFKKVNDVHGHNVGDMVLTKTTELIQSLIRSSDHVCRWGGEEFVIILPQTKVEGAKRLAESVRSSVEAADIQDALRVTASFGVAEHKRGQNREALVAQADECLYEAKNTGRNRVCAMT